MPEASQTRPIHDTEFDWFASDERGRVALFATGGSGPVPPSVLAYALQHDAAGDRIEVAGWGSNAAWASYSRSGLHAFDWSNCDGCYVRVAVPDGEMPEQVRAAVLLITDLPRVPLLFEEVERIAPNW